MEKTSLKKVIINQKNLAVGPIWPELLAELACYEKQTGWRPVNQWMESVMYKMPQYIKLIYILVQNSLHDINWAALYR